MKMADEAELPVVELAMIGGETAFSLPKFGFRYFSWGRVWILDFRFWIALVGRVLLATGSRFGPVGYRKAELAAAGDVGQGRGIGVEIVETLVELRNVDCRGMFIDGDDANGIATI